MMKRVCPICLIKDKQIDSFKYQDWQVTSCKQCDVVYLQNPPNYELAIEDFEWSASADRERSNRRKNSYFYYLVGDYLKKVKKFLRRNKRKEISIIEKLNKSGNFLDIGCGNGVTFKNIPSQYIPFGIEISPIIGKDADDICRKKGGYTIINNSLKGLKEFFENHFDVILMRSYLEHEIQPLEVLIEARRVLKDDGVIIIKVPNYNCLGRFVRNLNWPGYRFPDHVNYFTPKTLCAITAKAGLKVKKFTLFNRLSISDNMWAFFTKR